MYTNFAKWLIKLVISFQAFSVSHSFVHLYALANYKDFMGTYDLGNQHCFNLPSFLWYRLSSLKTDDCIMAYDSRNCEGISYRFHTGNWYNLAYISHTGGPSMNDRTVSIGRCKSSLGAATTHVQIYNGNELVLNIENLCDRVNISTRFSDASYINNNENCIILHQATKNTRLLAGRSYYSSDIQKVVKNYYFFTFFNRVPIIGISPCYRSNACNAKISLSASVVHFALIDGKKSKLAKSSDLSMSAMTTFINDGWATVSQEYKATKTITEATEITLVKSFSKMNNWHVGAKVELDIETGSWLLGVKSNIRTSLSTSYTREETETDQNINTRRHEVSTEFSVSEKIEIEPCTRYKVDSYVRVKERYPLLYNVTYEVKGTKGGKAMTAKEIRTELGKLNYTRDKDYYTVVASEISEIFLDFGVETIVDGEGEIIVECRDKQLKTQPVVKYLNVSMNAYNESLVN